jgi:REP element-mobilizing transposase RayT
VLKSRTRLTSFDYLGEYRYFLTFCTADRHHAFIKADVVETTLSQIVRASVGNAFNIPAYCLMPDHAHLLVEGSSPASDLRRFAKDAKQYSGFLYKREYRRNLWQPSYYDHVLRDDDDTWGVARYIVENPLRAGLSIRADEYPFFGSCVVTKQELLFSVSCAKPWVRT